MKKLGLIIGLSLVATPAMARRDIREVLATKKVTRTYTSANALGPLRHCLERTFEHVKMPMSLFTAATSFDNTRTHQIDGTTHISVSPSFGSDKEAAHRWMFTASLSPLATGTKVEIREFGKSFNAFRKKAELCLTQPQQDAGPYRDALYPQHGGTGSSTPANVADEIAKLAALRDKGIITEAEFQARKAALLK